MAKIIFDQNKALEADKGGGITVSGPQFGQFTNAEFGKSAEGAKYIEFSFENIQGAKANFLKIYLTSKEDKEIFGVNMLHSLIGLLKLDEAPIVGVGDGRNAKQALPSVCFKPIGVILRRENYKNKAGESKFKFSILHFIDPVTKKTFSETFEGKDALTIERLVTDIESNMEAPTTRVETSVTGPAEDDDLPF